MAPKTPKKSIVERPPIVVVMGHIDHGKSSLLDYIRKTSIVETETGGITQRVSAYEVEHTTAEGETKRITFLDTPGHEAFSLMRTRSAGVADVAILVVSAEDGVKAQTMEALAAIKEQKIPYVIAISKIDKPNANLDRVKSSLIEHEIYIEGMGGDVPYVPISSKKGDGINTLLDLVLLAAALNELTGDPELPAEGIVIEAHREEKRGIAATLIIKNGTLNTGDYIVTGTAIAPVRIMEDVGGHALTTASFSSPIRIVGFTETPAVGGTWHCVPNKKDAEKEVLSSKNEHAAQKNIDTDAEQDTRTVIPIIIKADVAGMIDAIEKQFEKIPQERVQLKVVERGVGTITENDIKAAGTGNNAIAIGFNVSVDAAARERALRAGVTIQDFDIIYRIGEWLEQAIKERTPKQMVKEVLGSAKILKTFSQTKNKQVIGARAVLGELKRGQTVSIFRKDELIGQGEILGLQHNRASVPKIEEGNEFGAEIESKIVLQGGDMIESFITALQ